jgi:hypothetical protein
MSLHYALNLLALFCLAVSGLAIGYAVYYQRRDMVPGYGGTMGGEMTIGLIWLLAGLLFGLGMAAFVPWYLAILAGIALVALSFAVRRLVASVPKRPR